MRIRGKLGELHIVSIETERGVTRVSIKVNLFDANIDCIGGHLRGVHTVNIKGREASLQSVLTQGSLRQ